MRSVSHSAAIAAFIFGAFPALAAGPANDRMTTPTLISDGQRTVYDSLIGAHPDSGVKLGGVTTRPSIWYRIDAPAPGWYYADTAGAQVRNGAKNVLLSVFRRQAGSDPVLLREGGRVTVDGASDTDLSGVRFLVTAGTDRILIAASVPSAPETGSLRLNLHRLGSTDPNPIVLTPPRPFGYAAGGVDGFLSFRDDTQFAIYNPLPMHPASIRFKVVQGLGEGGAAVVNDTLAVRDGEAVRVGLKSVGKGPDLGKLGSFDHVSTVEARSLGGGLVDKRAFLFKVIRSDGVTAAGTLDVTADTGFRKGRLGMSPSFDLQVRNSLGQAAKGCFLIADQPPLIAGGDIDVRPSLSWAVVDQQSGAVGSLSSPTFDLLAGASIKLRVLSEIRLRSIAEIAPAIVCASPAAGAGVAYGRLHPRLRAENTVFFDGTLDTYPEADIAFDDADGAAADRSPRTYAVEYLKSKSFAVVVRNRASWPRTLHLSVGQNSPLVPDVVKGPEKAKLCIAASTVGLACASPLLDDLALGFPTNATRRVIVTLPVGTAYGKTKRMYMTVSVDEFPIGISGFMVTGKTCSTADCG